MNHGNDIIQIRYFNVVRVKKGYAADLGVA